MMIFLTKHVIKLSFLIFKREKGIIADIGNAVDNPVTAFIPIEAL